MIRQFTRFSAIGVVGFVVDVLVLLLLVTLAGVDPYSSRAISFLAAATTTWWCNRHFTFAAANESALAQWGRFLAANGAGGAVNYGCYAALIAAFAIMHAHPAIAAAIGALAGLVVNFTLSRRFVFAATIRARPRGS